MNSVDREFDGWVVTEDDTRVQEPPMFKVLLHNDDYTAMDFVVMLLEKVFHKSRKLVVFRVRGLLRSKSPDQTEFL